MPTHDDMIQVARSVRRDMDREGKAFVSLPRMELTRRLRTVSGSSNTRIKAARMSANLEQALSDQGLRCYPHLDETTTGDSIRIFRAGSAVGELMDAVLVPSPDHDRKLAEALAKFKGTWDWEREVPPGARPLSTAEVVRTVLPREKHLAYVAALEDSDLATT